MKSCWTLAPRAHFPGCDGRSERDEMRLTFDLRLEETVGDTHRDFPRSSSRPFALFTDQKLLFLLPVKKKKISNQSPG